MRCKRGSIGITYEWAVEEEVTVSSQEDQFCPQGQQDMESPAMVPGSLLFGLASFCNNIITPLMHQSQNEESKIVAESGSEADSTLPPYLISFPWLHQQLSLEWIVPDDHHTNVRGKVKEGAAVCQLAHISGKERQPWVMSPTLRQPQGATFKLPGRVENSLSPEGSGASAYSH